MTDEQRQRLIDLYNHFRGIAADALEPMDLGNKQAENRFVDALAAMRTLDHALETLGYDIVIDDEDIARDIVRKES